MLAMYKCAVKDVLLKAYDSEEKKKTIVLDIMTWERTISTTFALFLMPEGTLIIPHGQIH